MRPFDPVGCLTQPHCSTTAQGLRRPAKHDIYLQSLFRPAAHMSTVTSPIDAEPVGPQGARVDITQCPALAVTGWLGVLVLAGTIWWIVVGNQHHSGWLWVPAVVFVLVLTPLVIVTPGQTSVVQFFGSYIGTVQRPGFWWVL